MEQIAISGDLEVPVGETYSLDEIHKLLHNISTLHTRGKTVGKL